MGDPIDKNGPNSDSIVIEENDNDKNIPDKHTCQKLVEEFAALTNTNVALAQFFLQDYKWNLQLSLDAYFESKIEVEEKDDSADVLVTYDSAKSEASLSHLILPGKITFKPPNKFRLLTWNLDGLDEHNLKKRTKAVAAILEMEKPDVVFFQEVIPVTFSYLEQRLPQYMFIAGDAKDYFVATLLLRTTVYFDGHIIHPFPNTRMGRNLLLVECHIGSLELRLLNSHLESTKDFSKERKQQLRSAFDLLKAGKHDSTSILAGDLNLRDNEVSEVGMPPRVSDMWEACGRRPECKFTWDTARNTNKSFPGKFKPRTRFDRVYLHQNDPAAVRPRHFGLVGIQKVSGTQSFPSDHWGVTVDFDIVNQRASSSVPLPSENYSRVASTVKSGPASASAAQPGTASAVVECFDVSDDAIALDVSTPKAVGAPKRKLSLIELE